MSNKIKVGSDFSGVGAFNQALKRLNIEYEEVFACDMDKYARKTFIHNYGEPKYFPENVYDREIPKEPLDIYMTSPPCQSFSLAGKRKGETDDRGVLFFNSHEFIQNNNPRYFIFENVKGLLSDDKGNTFSKWVQYLGGKSVNGLPTIFPHEKSVKYHLYYQVLNAKDYGVPQNRERIFLIGIRDDEDNVFQFPKKEFLSKRLRDILEPNVDEKYYLSKKMCEYLTTRSDNFNNGKINFKDENDIASCINASSKSIDISDNIIKVGYINQDTQASQVYSINGLGQSICAGSHGYSNGYIYDNRVNVIGAIRGRNFDNPKDRTVGISTQQRLEVNESGVSNALTTVQKDNVVVEYSKVNVVGSLPENHEQNSRIYGIDELSPTLTTMQFGGQEPKIELGFRIRKLTPRECFRLQDFPESFNWPVSDTQAYKQAGNSIPVGFLERIIKKLKL